MHCLPKFTYHTKEFTWLLAAQCFKLHLFIAPLPGFPPRMSMFTGSFIRLIAFRPHAALGATRERGLLRSQR